MAITSTLQTTTAITLSGKQAIIPDAAYGELVKHRANSWWNPLGPSPGIAWVLLLRTDLEEIKSRQTHVLRFTQTKFQGPASVANVQVYSTGGALPTRKSTATKTVEGLYLVEAQRVMKGGAANPNSLYLLRLADPRIIFRKSVLNRQFNVRMPAPSIDDIYDVRAFYTDSLNGGSLFTWATLLSTIWAALPGGYDAPTLPYTPNGTPENLRFVGVNAWDVLNAILAKLGCAVRYEESTGLFYYVRLGDEQPDPKDLPKPVFDAELYDFQATSAATVRTFFFDHYRSYGTETDTERDSQWSITPATTEDVPTTIDGAPAGTILAEWEDLPRVRDRDNADENASARGSRAAERTSNYKLDRETPRKRRVFGELLPAFTPGGQVRAVMWRHWGNAWGTQTDVVTHPGLPLRPMGDPSSGEPWYPDLAIAAEPFVGPDFSRHTFANYPRLPNIVQIVDPEASSGSGGTAPYDCLDPVGDHAGGKAWAGKLKRIVASAQAEYEDVWVWPYPRRDCAEISRAQITKLRKGDHYLGRLCGVAEIDGEVRPLYLIDAEQCLDCEGSGSGGCAVIVEERDVRCESGTLKIYKRTRTIAFVAGCLESSTGPWVHEHSAGCCECGSGCDCGSGSGSGSGSGGETGGECASCSTPPAEGQRWTMSFLGVRAAFPGPCSIECADYWNSREIVSNFRNGCVWDYSNPGDAPASCRTAGMSTWVDSEGFHTLLAFPNGTVKWSKAGVFGCASDFLVFDEPPTITGTTDCDFAIAVPTLAKTV